MIPLPGTTIPEPSTERRKRFVDEYFADYNATAAAIRAGFSEASANQYAYELMHDPTIKAAILKRKNELFDAIEVTKDVLVKRLKEIALTKATDIVEFGPDFRESKPDENGKIFVSNGVRLNRSDEITEAAKGAISEISNTKEGVKLKMYDARAAVMDLAKLGGLVIDRAEVNTTLELDLSKLSDEALDAYMVIAREVETQAQKPDSKPDKAAS